MFLAGDFMQLAPFESRVRVSLLLPPKPGTSDEHANGIRCFQCCVTDLMPFDKCYCLRDVAMPRLMGYMRGPEGICRPDDLWAGLNGRVAKVLALSNDALKLCGHNNTLRSGLD